MPTNEASQRPLHTQETGLFIGPPLVFLNSDDACYDRDIKVYLFLAFYYFMNGGPPKPSFNRRDIVDNILVLQNVFRFCIHNRSWVHS